ncbi:MAG: hypothetical protein PHS62_00335 [Patescibacteria group bacterium]|nr:hypothetical protein [Patescibacteria group bacterium]
MFNPLSFFKKKPAEQPAGEELAAAEPVKEKQIQIDNIAIHTMPERFRHKPIKADSAKTAGLMIVGGGVLFLAAVSAGLYFYLLKEPAVTVKTELTAVETNPPAENAAEAEQNQTDLATTSTETAALSTEETAATSTTATSTLETVEPETSIGLIPALDSDADGLANAEEFLLGTATSSPDTDGDSYLDGDEVMNLYNPAGSGKLIDNPAISLYENNTYKYIVLYPSAWQMSLSGGDDSIMFKTDDNQFFGIIVQANEAKATLDQWYLDQLGVSVINDADRLAGAGWQGIKNLDGLTAYLMDAGQNYIFTITYNPGENNILDYIDIFNMMVKSFTLKQ